ncbi:hypothetical protein [Inquilinus sp. CAU 1745]|uniref:hypothetical protein n=1 Tax=Inquilinus sp. CAU 1745 TaxID=3140369 RepID=UPI00325AE589
MRKALLIGFFTLAAGPSFAQTDETPRTPDAGPEQAQDAPAQEEAPATSAPETEAEAAPPPTPQPDAGEPANLCQELLSFMQTPPPEPAAEAAPAQQEQSGENQSEDQEGSPESQGTAQESEGTTQDGEGTPGEASGSDAAAHSAPDPQSGDAAQSNSNNEQAQQTSSLSAPVPTEPTTTSKLEVMTVDQAEDLAAANDIQACKDAARELRLAGVAMPPALLALTALDLQYQQTESQAQ